MGSEMCIRDRDYLDACPVLGTRLGGGGEIMLTNAEVREHSQQAQQQ